MDQARSLASHMHNSDTDLEYFTLEFPQASSAFHASSALSQAVFVNDALRSILDIYALGMYIYIYIHVFIHVYICICIHEH